MLKAGVVGGRLLNTRIGNAGNAADPAQQIMAYTKFSATWRREPWRSIGAGAPKFRILADDIGGQEREAHAGNARGSCSRRAWTYSAGADGLSSSLNLNVAVLRTDHARVVVGHIDADDRHPDVIGEGIDLFRRDDLRIAFCTSPTVGGFLDPSADLGTDMHQDIAGIDGGKEIAAEERHQQK